MLESLKQRVFEANLDLVAKGLVIYTWGNCSEIDRETNLVVIKPSGVDYDTMKASDMVVVDLQGNIVEGDYRPSSDTPTHLELYKRFPSIGGITHTHSVNAVAFAQAGRPVQAFGTTHADYFYGDIPVSRALTKEEVFSEYEKNTGKVIIETVEELGYDPLSIPAILVKNHGPFSWGKDAKESVYHAVVLEKVAEMGLKTLLLNPNATIDSYVLDKHYMRKHGPNAYYGQKPTQNQI